MKIGLTDYNIEKEFNIYLKKVNRQFMYDRCREYKVRIKKDDSLPALCYKYICKKRKMKPWEYPDDENGNAVWLNPIVNLEDDFARYIFCSAVNGQNKKKISDESLLKFKEKIMDEICKCINLAYEYGRDEEIAIRHKRNRKRY